MLKDTFKPFCFLNLCKVLLFYFQCSLHQYVQLHTKNYCNNLCQLCLWIPTAGSNVLNIIMDNIECIS